MEEAQAHCCGLAFRSKGFFAAGDAALEGLYRALPKEVLAGEQPLLCEAAPCALRLQRARLFKGIEVLDAIACAKNILLPRLTGSRGNNKKNAETAVVAHLPCASRRAGLEQDFLAVLAAFSAKPPQVAAKTLCCGFGGDVGLRDAALNRHALAGLIEHVRQGEVALTEVVSASRTCEIGLAWHAGGGSAEGVSCHSLFQWLERRSERIENLHR